MYSNRVLLIFLLIFGVCQAASIQCKNSPEERSTFLWSIKAPDQKRHSFLFGTIHVAYDRVWASVSTKLKEVLSRVETLVLELALHDPSTVEKLIECKQLGQNQTLYQLLPTSLFLRLKKYFSSFRQLSRLKTLNNELNQQVNSLINAWETRRPVWLLFLLYQLSEEQLKQSNLPMLDAYLAQKSHLLRKQLHSIETPEEQCDPLIGLDQEQVIFAINYTLSYLEWNKRNPHRFTSKKSTIEDLIQLYKCGDLQVTKLEGWRLHESSFTLNEDLDEQARKVDEQLKHDLIDQRNARMAMRAHNLMKEHPNHSYLFALGAGHFNGQYSLINILKNYGYTIEPINEDVNIDDFFLGQMNFKNFNELWVRNHDKNSHVHLNKGLNDNGNNRIYYILILSIFILSFICIVHKISQYFLLRVIVMPKTYDQVVVLPNYL